MCGICRYWLGESEGDAKKCNGVHYCWGRDDSDRSGSVCGGRVRGEGLPNWIACTNGHGSIGLVVRKTKPGWDTRMAANGIYYQERTGALIS